MCNRRKKRLQINCQFTLAKIKLIFANVNWQLILLSNKLKIRKLKYLHVLFDEYWFKQLNLLEYGSYHLDPSLKGTATAVPGFLREKKSRLKFLYRQRKDLNPAFWKRPSTVLIQLNWLPISEIYRTMHCKYIFYILKWTCTG